jgi:hypothetical protein
LNVLRIVRLKGTQGEMGAQYGQIMRDHGRLEESEQTYTTLAGRMLKDANHRTLSGRLFNAVTGSAMSMGTSTMQRQRPEDYLERTREYLRTSGLPRHWSKHTLLMDAFQNLVGLAGRYKLGPFAKQSGRAILPACSSLAVWGTASVDGKVRHARNFDYPCIGVWDERPTVVFCTPDTGLKYGFVSSFGVDVAGVTAFNEAGLCVAVHTRFHRDVRWAGAAVTDVGHDIIRKAETLADAVAICRERPIASTWGICITSASERRSLVVETTGEGAWVVAPSAGDDFIYCTNRNRHPDLIMGQVSPMAAWPEHSDGREKRIKQRVVRGMGEGGLNLQQLKDLLGDYYDPSVPGARRAGGGVVSQAMTVASVVFTPEDQAIELSLGDAPTGWGPYLRIPWEWTGEVGVETIENPECEGERRSFGEAHNHTAYLHWQSASRIDIQRHEPAETLEQVEKAIETDPTEPTYRTMAGILRLRLGDWEQALAHFEVGMQRPQSAFRRGQVLLWGARAAEAAGQPEKAHALRNELLLLMGEHTQTLRQMAAVELDKPVSSRRLRKLTYNVDLVDAVI